MKVERTVAFISLNEIFLPSRGRIPMQIKKSGYYNQAKKGSQTVVSQCVQGRTGASTISFVWRDVFWPLAICTRVSLWSNMVDLEIGRNQIEQEEPQIPNEDSNGLDSPSDRRDKEHGS